MQVEVRSAHIRRAHAMRFYAVNCIEARLRRLSHAVRTVVLRIRRINGSPTGALQQCQADLHLTSGERLILSDVDDDVYRAIDRIVDRAKCTLVRRLARARRSHRRMRRSSARSDW